MKKYLSFVKFEHTLFSFPVVISGAMVSADGLPGWRTAVLILIAAAGARTAAMSANRIIDCDIDRKNPRTGNREMPSGLISRGEAYGVTIAGLSVYFLSAYFICPFALYLSPIPVAVFAAYPYMKRFTPLCHFGVGFALALAPAGGWVAVKCSLQEPFAPAMLGLFMLFWVAGFDIAYSTQDEQFDRENGLRSIPVSFGAQKALKISLVLHWISIIPLAALQATEFGGNIFSFLTLAAICAVLTFEYFRAYDTEFAFFKLNALAGGLVLVFIICGIYLGRSSPAF